MLINRFLIVFLFCLSAILFGCAEEEVPSTTGTSVLQPSKANCGDSSCL